MKKIIKYVGIVLAVIVGLAFVLSNIINVYLTNKKNNQPYSLEEIIAGINTNLPQKGFESYDFFTLERCKLEGNNLVWEGTLDAAYINSIRESALPESVNGFVVVDGSSRNDVLDIDSTLTIEFFQQSIRFNLLYQNLIVMAEDNGRSNQFEKEMAKRHCSQIWRAYSPFSNTHVDFTLTYQLQKDIEEYCKHEKELALSEFIIEYIKRQNLLLGEASKHEDIKMDMVLDDTCFVLRCVFEETFSEHGNHPIENIRMVKEQVENDLQADALSLPLFFDFKRICEATGKGYTVRYVDCNDNDSIDFRIY